MKYHSFRVGTRIKVEDREKYNFEQVNKKNNLFYNPLCKALSFSGKRQHHLQSTQFPRSPLIIIQ